jgi:hypothetical protein
MECSTMREQVKIGIFETLVKSSTNTWAIWHHTKEKTLVELVITCYGQQNWIKNQDKFSLVPMGALTPGSAQSRSSAQPPIDTSGNLSAQLTKNQF